MSETNSKKEENQLVEVVNSNMLEPVMAENILSSFEAFYSDAKKLAVKARNIVITNDEQVTEMKLARECRLELRDIRLDVEKKRVSLKAHVLREGKAIDGMSNVIKLIIEPMEEYLKESENYIVNKKKKALEELETKRSNELLAVECEPSDFNLQIMSEETYQKQLKIATGYYKKLKKEEAAEEKARVKEEARLKLSNDRKFEIEEYRGFFSDTDYDESSDNIADYKKAEFSKLKNELKGLKEKSIEKQKEIEAENKKLKESQEKKQKAHDDQMRKEKEKAQKIQAELEAKEKKAKEELEVKEEKERKEEAERKAAKEKGEEEERQKSLAPDKEKLNELANKIASIEMPKVKDKKAMDIILKTIVLLDKTSNYIKVNALGL